jgi:hypothetical protein
MHGEEVEEECQEKGHQAPSYQEEGQTGAKSNESSLSSTRKANGEAKDDQAPSW